MTLRINQRHHRVEPGTEGSGQDLDLNGRPLGHRDQVAIDLARPVDPAVDRRTEREPGGVGRECPSRPARRLIDLRAVTGDEPPGGQQRSAGSREDTRLDDRAWLVRQRDGLAPGHAQITARRRDCQRFAPPTAQRKEARGERAGVDPEPVPRLRTAAVECIADLDRITAVGRGG